MADDGLISKVQGLSDLELAFLLSLAVREHCIISTPSNRLNDLTEELHLVRPFPTKGKQIYLQLQNRPSPANKYLDFKSHFWLSFCPAQLHRPYYARRFCRRHSCACSASQHTLRLTLPIETRPYFPAPVRNSTIDFGRTTRCANSQRRPRQKSRQSAP